MFYIKSRFPFILICMSLLSCSFNPQVTNNIKDQTYISKSNIEINSRGYPKKLNVFYLDSKPEDFIEGIYVNFFLTKKQFAYVPELLFVNLLDSKDCKRLEIEKDSYSIIYLNDKNLKKLTLDCLSKIKKSSGIVINFSKNNFSIEGDYKILLVERIKTIKDLTSYARENGSMKTIIIDDESTNDKEAIKNLWEVSGGKVIATATLNNESESQKLLSRVLLLGQSEIRKRKLSRKIGLPLENKIRRRQDVDSFIISTNLENARNLRPAFEYNFANLLPVYFIPSWNSDEVFKDKEHDLERSVITDMPLILKSKIEPSSLNKVKKSRKFAAGYDAFELAILLNNEGDIEYFGMMGFISNKSKDLRLQTLRAEVIEGKFKYLNYSD